MEASHYESAVQEEGKPIVVAFFDKKDTSFTSTFVVVDKNTKSCIVFDPVLSITLTSGDISTHAADKIVHFVQHHGLKVEYVIDTHVHADHITGAHYIKEKLGGKYGIGFNITQVQKFFADYFNLHDFATDGSQFDVLFKDGEEFTLGSIKCQAFHTPGHTPACMTYLVGDAIFCGDTIFMPDMGTARCDFPNGSAQTLWNSVHKILALEPNTRIFVGHDYAPGGRDYQWETTVEHQKKHNKHVKEGTTMEEFITFRTTRDKELAIPDLFYPSIQINIRGGQLPPAEPNGKIYFKTPLTIKH